MDVDNDVLCDTQVFEVFVLISLGKVPFLEVSHRLGSR